jgi:uncharacterized protein YbbK (DUF523 family)
MFLPTEESIRLLPNCTSQNPIKILVSACLSGQKCGADGTSYGEYPLILKILELPNVKPVTFCPENFSFGTPRAMPDIHGGSGFDVLDGKARVLTDRGDDWTQGMIRSANEMLKIALENKVDLAILMDMSVSRGMP